MNKLTLGFIVVVLLINPALGSAQNNSQEKNRGQFTEKVQSFRQQQMRENSEFRQALKDLSPELRRTAAINHREEQYRENVAFGNEIFEKRKLNLDQRLNQAGKLTESQRNDIKGFAEAKYQERLRFKAEQHKDNIALIDQLSRKTEQDQEAVKSAIRVHMEKQKSALKAFLESQKAERKAFRESLKEEVQSTL